MSNTAISIRDDQTVFDEWQTKALAHLGVETANKADLAVFFHTCKRTGLDPFARQIYMIRRDGKQTMQTGIDGLRLVAQRTAERTGESFGYEDAQWCGEDGQWRDVWLSSDPPAAAKVAVVRNGQRFPVVALYGEYVARKRDGNVTKMWQHKAALMLAKCAEAGALRKAFPMDLSGIYTADEFREQPQQPARPQVTAETFTATGGAESVADVSDAEVVEGDPEPDDGFMVAEVVEDHPGVNSQQLKALHASFGDAGIAEREQRLDYCRKLIGRDIESSNDLTRAEASQVLDALKVDAEQGDQDGGQ